MAEESGDIFSKAWAYVAYGSSCFAKGFLDEALDYSSKSADCCDRIDALNANSLAQQNMALIHFARGEYRDSEYCFSRSIAYMEQYGAAPEMIKILRIGLAMASVMNNNKDIDIERLRDYAHRLTVGLFKAWAFRFMANIMLNIDNDCLPEAEYWIKNAIEVDRKNSLMFYLGVDYAIYSEIFKRKGDQIKATENLDKAIEIFNGCGADGWVKKFEKELDALT